MGVYMKTVLDFLGRAASRLDKWLLLFCISVSAVSLVLLYGALESGYKDLLNISARHMAVQGAAIALGVLCALALSLMDYQLLRKLSFLHVPLTYLLMLLTFWIGVGVPARPDDKRWLVLPVLDVWLQPAELLKISFVVIFALHIAKLEETINRPLHLLTLLAHAAVPILLVHFQGDDGSALMLLLIAVVMLFCGGLGWRYVAAGVFGAAAAIPILWNYVLEDFQKTRLRTLFEQSSADPLGNYYQQHRAMMALANGGTTGVGLFGQHIYVPEMHTDFAFAFFCECFGFMGALGLLALMMVLCFKVLYDARFAKDRFGALICAGVFALILFPCVINVAMCVSLMPVIGNPFPFLSYGGSSTVSNYVAVGLVLSVYGHGKRELFS